MNDMNEIADVLKEISATLSRIEVTMNNMAEGVTPAQVLLNDSFNAVTSAIGTVDTSIANISV